jgi:hypothetical protein
MKKTLDKYISENYDEVRKYTNHFLKAYNNKKNINLSMLNADTVINNAYLHVLTINTEKTDANSVKSYLLNTIKCQIIWDTSISHKQDDCKSIEYVGKDEIDDDEVSRKIAIEQRFNDQRAYIEIFRRQITDPIERITFECYYDKGYNTARSLSKYFGIPATSAHYMLRDIKQKIRQIQYSYEAKDN